eukprot:symbB.v1.2.032495.t1/scaffold3908.1/size48452/1
MASQALACPSDEVLFKAAQDAVKTLPELDDRNKLRLYAHYKQATVGPAQGSRPSIFQQVARAKWDAWSELQSMNNIDAMRGYCSLADEFVPGWRNSVQEGHSSLHAASFQDSSAKLDSLERWGYEDTRFVASSVSKLRGAVGIEVTFTSDRYPVSRKANGLWDFFQEVGLHLKVKDSPKFLPKLPDSESCESTSSLMDLLQLEDELVSSSPLDRLRGGTSQVFCDLWRLRHGALGDRRMPDLVVQPRCEGHVMSILEKAAGSGSSKFMVIPSGGRTGASSSIPSMQEDPRPVVSLDMRRMNKILWIRHEDRIACIEAGITGRSLKDLLAREGYTMGMEPDSMEFSTLGGWIATKTHGLKQSRYGNIDEMLVEVRVATSSGLVWQKGMKDRIGSIGRRSTGLELPGLLLGSGGCLGVITAAVVRIHPLPECLEYDSLRFSNWDMGVSFLKKVAQLPRALKPASCRLLDSTEIKLAEILREDLMKSSRSGGESAALLVLEGSHDEVAAQRQELSELASAHGGSWTGAAMGEVSHQMNFVFPYIRDFGIDYNILVQPLEVTLPWSRLGSDQSTGRAGRSGRHSDLWASILQATTAEHRRRHLPGALKLWRSCLKL